LDNLNSLGGINVSVTPQIMQQLLTWASRFGSCCFLDNHSYESKFNAHEFLIGAGVVRELDVPPVNSFKNADSFIKENHGKWIFGHLSYELLHAHHGLQTIKKDNIDFPLITLFVPQVVFKYNGNQVEIIIQDESLDSGEVWQQILLTPISQSTALPLEMVPRISREEYIKTVNNLRSHILRGDCYEINFCQEFFSEQAEVDPLSIYQALAKASPNPFSCYYKYNEAHLMCASPERYLTKRGNKLYSQPIKGTAPRNADVVADLAAKEALANSKKELSENVMVVDLVRNDFSIICEKGSVQVDELYGIYSYPQVHQMISTISGILKEETSFSDILCATFPIGSMTGAPKHRVMELIELYESSRRGLFAGAVGYIAPNGNFDFNVVIRSILYNTSNKYLSYLVGSGITWYSKADAEYEECLWKAEAIKKILNIRPV
jgi:para-aminobenzoate synthetase component 1